MILAEEDARLVEVAVTLPVPGTFTYRDPRPGGELAVGTEVVVPFGGRTVTGFVLGPSEAPPSGARPRDIERVVGPGTAVDEDVLALCRFAADYYQAPLGELLRAALPQGERTTSVRQARLTDEGRRVARGEASGVGAEAAAPPPPPAAPQQQQTVLAGIAPGRGGVGSGGDGDGDGEHELGTGAGASGGATLQALADAGGSLPVRVLARRAGGNAGRLQRQLAALEAAGLIEVGDHLRDRRPPPTVGVVIAAGGRTAGDAALAALPAQARARRALFARVLAAPAGLLLAELSPAARAQARALAAAGLARIELRPAPPSDAAGGGGPGAGDAALPALTPAQARATDELADALGSSGFAPFLLQGVTGSGKTEVYLRLIATARAAGRGALVLVPEIALTPQLAARFRARFGDDLAVLHSGLPARERLAAWRRLRAGEVGIALGARSAVFAPVPRLGVVVVDEEHDPSFKQEEGVRYNARDLALLRAQRAGAVVVLGSATPSLESYRNAAQGRFRRLLLPERATPRPLPPVEVVDLRRHPPGPDGLLSAPLAEAVAANLSAGQQTILFLNRRGFSTVALCRACGHVVRCSHCSVSLTYHHVRARMICHYCGASAAVPQACPSCRSPRIERLGTGTERVEALVRERFPGARVARLDRDTAGGSRSGEQLGGRGAGGGGGEGAGEGGGGGLEQVLRAMQAGEIDILVGTQMVTKGHDFGGVTLVGVLNPDQAMHMPDFRATERVFQLLEQVAGRAGRGDRPGRVMVQTYRPEHPAIVAVRDHDYEGFVRAELVTRDELGYPPGGRMVALRIDGTDEGRVRADAAAAAAAAGRAGGDKLRVRGPAEAPIARVRGRFRYQVWLSSPERAPLAAAARAASAVPLSRDVRLVVDVDPQSCL